MKTKFFKRFSIFLTFIFILTAIPIYTLSAEDTEKAIYLTFDDGPGGKVTTEILDILKEENVHATFFLIGGQIKGQEDTIRRMKEEGHSLGLHSMTHEKCKLYSSEEGFLKEMLEVQTIIKDITGDTTYILRFPFGCNNTSYHLKSHLVELLHENNFKIYDWNVDSTDGANPSAPPSTFVKNAKSDKDTIFLLMHCGYQSKHSVQALPEIIKYYKDNGYTFKTINIDTPEVFHYMKGSK